MHMSVPKKYIKVSPDAPTTWINGRTGRAPGPGPGCVYLQCSSDLKTGVLCKNEIFITVPGGFGYSINEVTDDEARAIFESNGWTIGPTWCPECQLKAIRAANILDHSIS